MKERSARAADLRPLGCVRNQAAARRRHASRVLDDERAIAAEHHSHRREEDASAHQINKLKDPRCVGRGWRLPPVQRCESGSKVPGAAIISIARLRSCSAVVAAAPAVSKLARAQTVRLWSRGAVEKNLEADGRRGTAENGGVEPKRATAQGDETANPQVHDSPVQLRATPSAIK